MNNVENGGESPVNRFILENHITLNVNKIINNNNNKDGTLGNNE
jgi:hypothetical protein